MWASVRLMLGIICNNAALSENSSIRSNKRKKENSGTEKPPANASHEILSRRIIPGCGYMRPFSMASVLLSDARVEDTEWQLMGHEKMDFCLCCCWILKATCGSSKEHTEIRILHILGFAQYSHIRHRSDISVWTCISAACRIQNPI